MRIIAGKFRGRRLVPVRGEVRPTSDRLRETVFNILGESVRESSWLELFAGTGAVGLEALSRGASRVAFNDAAREAVETVRRNLRLCAVQRGVEVSQRPAFQFLRSYRGAPFDFIYLDPPYRFGRYARLLKSLAGSGALGAGSLVLLEVFKKTSLDFLGAAFELVRVISCGDSRLLLLRRVSGSQESQSGAVEGGVGSSRQDAGPADPE